MVFFLATISCFTVFSESDIHTDHEKEKGLVIVELEEEIVVTASKNTEKRLYTTQPVHIVDEKSVYEEMPVTPSNLLKSIPGVTLNTPGGFSSNPIIRGLGGRRVIMLIDGQRVDTEKTVGVTGYFVEAHDLQQIEVMKGPGSVLYGSDAISGVINMLSKDVLKINGFTAGNTFYYGSNNREASNFFFSGIGNGKIAFKLTGKFRDALNIKTGKGTELENSFYSDKNFGFKFGWKPLAKQVLRFSGSFFDGKDIGKAANSGDDEKRRRIYFPKDRHYSANLKYELNNYGIMKKTSFSVYGNFTERHQHADFYTAAWTEKRTEAELDHIVEKHGEFLNIGWAYNTFLQPLQFTEIIFGTDGKYKNLKMEDVNQSMQKLPNGQMLPEEKTYPFDDASQVDIGLFAQAKQTFFEKLSLKAGARYDVIHTNFFYNEETYKNNPVYGDKAGTNVSGIDHAFSGNSGILYAPFDELIISFNFGRAFRSPTLREKYSVVDSCKGRYIGNEKLKPESSLNFDLGFKGKVKYFVYEAYGFTTLIDNYIAGFPTENEHEYKYENIVDARLYGVEGKIVFDYPEAIWKFGVKISSSVGYVYGEDASKNEPLPNIPPLTNVDSIRFYLRTLSFIDNIFAEGRFTWNSSQDRINPGLNTGSVEETGTDRYYLFDFLSGIKSKKFEGFNSQLNFSVFNIANSHYRDHLSPVNGMGRNIKIGITLNYEL
jgi:hemoglobin/transferrin/lactoferrin receptor protein